MMKPTFTAPRICAGLFFGSLGATGRAPRAASGTGRAAAGR
jgi:hypothetical protein